MLTAHLPAGYLVTLLFNRAAGTRFSYWRWGLPLAIWPDLDIPLFILAPPAEPVHHAYAPHLPFCWLLALCLLPLAALPRIRERCLGMYGLFLANWLAHLLLDSVSGTGVRWLWPLDDRYFYLISIPFSPHSSRWLLDCALHWSFSLELLVWLPALLLLLARWRKGRG